MSRKAPLTILVMLPLALAAQQMPQYTQYVFNHFSVNPAVAGSKDCLDMRMGYRRQWLNFEGAPNTAWASVHAALKAKGKPFVANKHGIGLMVEADEMGPLSTTNVQLAYAYHLQTSRDFYIAMGIFGGLKQVRLDAGRVTLTNFNDPAIDGSAQGLVLPEITPGIWIYGKRLWLGAALHQTLGNRVEAFGVESRLNRQFFLSGGYRYAMGKDLSFTPSTLIKVGSGVPMALDLNAMVEFKRVLGLGVGYRNTDAVTAMIKVGFAKYFQLGYSYDITTSKLRVASANTHEIILAITPCTADGAKRRMISCPAFD